jgi:hypothetical protein
MLIGILADIHEAVDHLQRALDEFRMQRVDIVVSLGDACDTFGPGGRTGEVAALLRAAGAVGVWGNHDVGLCWQVPELIRQRTDPAVLQYMAGMQAQFVVAGCRFSHVEPWLDARRVEDLWYFDGPLDTPDKASRSFAAVPERHLFVGHFHRWLVMTPTGRVDWAGEKPLDLCGAGRYLVVVAPVLSGWCAIFNTASSQLTPLRRAA